MATKTTSRKTTTRKTNRKSAEKTSIIKAPISSTMSINGGELNLPAWDANGAMPTDLFTDSSSIPATTKADADAQLEQIEQRRNTMRIVQSNIGLIGDVAKAAIDYRKVEGLAIDYRAVGIQNQAKEVKVEIETTRLQSVEQKLRGEQEKLEQSAIQADALTEITGITRDEWEQRKLLAQSKVNSLKVAVEQADQSYQESLRKLMEGEDSA